MYLICSWQKCTFLLKTKKDFSLIYQIPTIIKNLEYAIINLPNDEQEKTALWEAEPLISWQIFIKKTTTKDNKNQ